ncbi:MAG: cellulase family glycosylhydrolase [Bradyrhizobium sp.]|nr:cellulase family glycosylhydrolase [Bradyrhizobium sp.]
MRILALIICAAAILPVADAWAAPWTVSVDERNGLPTIGIGGAPAMTTEFAFWGSNWRWADTQPAFRVVGPFDYVFTAQNSVLQLDLRGTIRRQSEQQLRYELEIDARQSQSNVIGGGLSFRFDLPKGMRQLGEPELLPGNAGWAWGRAQSTRIEVRFDPPPASTFFERGSKSEVRAFFFGSEIPQGVRRYALTVTLSGDFQIAPTLTERYGPSDSRSWPTGILFDSAIAPWNVSPVDLSFLNAAERPAGKRGFIRAAKDSLTFEDGTPARFWGTNLTAYALFGTTRDNVKRQARRLSELGFNLVRLHHHDSYWVNPNVFGNDAANTRNLDESALAQLDWWIKCLKDEGIYVWLDLHAQRGLKGGDNIEAYSEIAKGRPFVEPKGYNYVNPSIQDAMKDFNAAYVNHLNRFTELRYKDDPAIVAMLVTNENDVTFHFGNGLLPVQNIPWHSARFMAEARAFAARNSLPADAVARTWEAGPSKLFLNDLEQRFHNSMIEQLHRLGVKVPLAATSYWGGVEPLNSIPALTAGDLIDVHSYGGVAELERNPVYAANLVDWIAAAQVVGKPLSVTEWNVSPFPTPDRHSAPLYVAASAALQGWDALMQYAYTGLPLNDRGVPSNWHGFNDPGLLATLPAAALLYRRQDVREADTTYVYAPSERDLFYRAVSPDNSAALRTATQKGKLLLAMPATASLPWLHRTDVPSGARVLTDPDQPLIDAEASEISSDTGELRRNWERGTFTINTARTQAATGWIGGRSIALADVVFDISTPNASVAVQSLDGQAIPEAKSLLISLGARSIPAAGNRVPFSSEPVTGTLQIRAQAGLKLFRRTLPGEEREVRTDYRDGRYVVALDRGLSTYWLVLK